MKPSRRIATAQTPSGGEMILYQHDGDFSIRINGQDLMHSRQHESELALARLGCAHLVDRRAPSILIGGLGMGYTLRQALDMLSPHTRVVVSELLDVVVEWNRRFLGILNGQPLQDQRVVIETDDIVEIISHSMGEFDAILLDVDNGPSALTDRRNDRLYGHEGIRACRRALREQGCLAVWSAEASSKFEQLLIRNGFHVRRFRVSAAKGGKSKSRFVWVASEDKNVLPRGGGEPHLKIKDDSKAGRRRPREKAEKGTDQDNLPTMKAITLNPQVA
jgi:spermidine synthase